MTDWLATYALEADLARDADEYIAKRGDVLLTRVESGGTSRKNRKSTKGTADRVGLVQDSGRHIEIEYKRAKGTSSPEQIARCNAVRRLGGVYEVCRTVRDVHEAIEQAKGLP